MLFLDQSQIIASRFIEPLIQFIEYLIRSGMAMDDGITKSVENKNILAK